MSKPLSVAVCAFKAEHEANGFGSHLSAAGIPFTLRSGGDHLVEVWWLFVSIDHVAVVWKTLEGLPLAKAENVTKLRSVPETDIAHYALQFRNRQKWRLPLFLMLLICPAGFMYGLVSSLVSMAVFAVLLETVRSMLFCPCCGGISRVVGDGFVQCGSCGIRASR
jgi:hypothetical protein